MSPRQASNGYVHHARIVDHLNFVRPRRVQLAPQLRPMQRRLDAGCPQRLQIRNEVATLLDDDRLDLLHAFDDARARLEAMFKRVSSPVPRNSDGAKGTMMDMSPRGRS